MYLRFLCFPMEFDYQAPVKDYKGQDEGLLDLYITPCTANGNDIQDLDLIVSENPEAEEAVEELRGKPFYFKVKIADCSPAFVAVPSTNVCSGTQYQCV